MGYIIAHESAHLKRKDHWWKAFGYGLLCVYWFYPLCWLAYFLFGRDMELACDEWAVKGADFHEKKEYSRVLLSCARQKREVLVCPLAFGEVGVKERVKSVLHYKKPALWIVIAAVAICVMLAVCFLTNPAKEYQIPSSVETMDNSLPTEEVTSLQEEVIPAKSEPIQDIVFHEQPEADKVCIEVQPSIIREYLSYYYIPTEKDQEWLSERVKALDLEGKPFAKRWEGHKEIGWQIIYNDWTFRVFEGGYLYYTYDGENGEMECLIEDTELCGYIQNMLINKIGYRHYGVADIKEIVSAKLEVASIYTGWKSYSQTITDADTLKKFEEWFCNAKYVYGGTDCGYESACLELTLASGDVVKLSMATDDCPNFNINGVVYDYRPVSDWNNRDFYKCFDEIPWEYSRENGADLETKISVNDSYYSMVTDISSTEVEDYANYIKQLFMEHDWLAISSEIAYPITISGTMYTDSTVFLDASDNFDGNLNEDFFSYLKEEDCVEMFINSQGIMLGATGQVWIADVLDDKSNSHGLKIITINDLLKE